MLEYYAKSYGKDGSAETVKEHLQSVSDLASKYGAVFNEMKQTYLCGLLHDFGKYSDAFQCVLEGTKHNIDHAVCGAVFLNAITKGKPVYRPIIEAIASHHSELRSYSDLSSLLREILESDYEITTFDDGKLSALTGKKQYQVAASELKSDFPDFTVPAFPKIKGNGKVEEMLYTRMLFSCLVDADYTASAVVPPIDAAPIDAKRSLDNLYAYYTELQNNSKAKSELNQYRTKLFNDCGIAGEQDGGVFTLTAPTGTGKTLALLHFALRHCQYTGKRRIIVVLPFLSLIEQSTGIYGNIIPDILEDHSQADLPNEMREHAARWDQPFIITTSVRFFESLFSSKPTDCRKLHNIADSIILFDESQSLPVSLTKPTIDVVNELCSRYNCTMVFSTATQPSFEKLADTIWAPKELLPDYRAFYNNLRRCSINWEIDTPTDFSEIAFRMASERNVCTIVNLRRHAGELFSELVRISCSDSIYLLSTDLCPGHRSRIITEIKQKQKTGEVCRVISTQCIEAGVDLDFDIMFRALAPMEAIVQAAGRCNRNGTFPDATLTIFVPNDDGSLYPDDHYKNSATIVKEMYIESDIDIQSPECINEYYSKMFCNFIGDKKSRELKNAISEMDYSRTEKLYRLIDNRGVQVIVPYSSMIEEYEDIRTEALKSGLTGSLIRRAAPLTITFYVNKNNEDMKNLLEPLYFAGHREKVESGFYILCTGKEHLYSDKEGLKMESGQTTEDLLF